MELIRLDDSATTRITTERIFGRFLRAGYRVSWIAWDSPFRDVDLQIGDLIVGLNGRPYANVHDGNTSGSAIGMHGEEYYWKTAGGKDGDNVILNIVRGERETELVGQLRAGRIYYTAEGKRALAPGGPETLSNDGFSSAWSRWYEEVLKEWSFILNNGWNRSRLNNRSKLAEHLEHSPRIQHLQVNHPGLFAETMRADYERVIECLRGTRYELTEDDLAYRELGETRAALVATEARIAWNEKLASVAADLMPAFPAPDPEKRAAVIGKIVELPWIMLQRHQRPTGTNEIRAKHLHGLPQQGVGRTGEDAWWL